MVDNFKNIFFKTFHQSTVFTHIEVQLWKFIKS